MMAPRAIESDTLLDDVDHNFRVFAGPGAGKTFWLIEHLKNVLARSDRLTTPARVACVSYTNVAVTTIQQKLGRSADRVDVSTIHSFFYRNVVKPYLHLLRNGDGESLVNYAAVDGHDEHRPSVNAVRAWLASVGARERPFLAGMGEWLDYLAKLSWRRDRGTGEWSLKRVGRSALPKYLPATKLGSYKQHYWALGTIDHEDVLYFTYRILEENPRILPFLSARFPYLFIDEFQDTNPIQTQMAKWLAGTGTVIGVIGDAEQAIFGFQGSDCKDFVDFAIPGQIDYEIKGNRRSTNQIVDLLNHIRSDPLTQDALRQADGEWVRLLVGPIGACVESASNAGSDGEDHEIVVLARNNATTSQIRRLFGTDDGDIWNRLRALDRDREWLLRHVVSAGELARRDQCPLAVKTAIRGLRVRAGEFRSPLVHGERVSDVDRRGLAVRALEYVVSQHRKLTEGTLLQAYLGLAEALGAGLPGLRLKRASSGKFKSFAEKTAYNTMVESVILTEDTRRVRTIHKAKGDEFRAVLVVLAGEDELLRILAPSKGTNNEKEERRITYVALSRARDRLLISVPELSPPTADQLATLGVKVVECQQDVCSRQEEAKKDLQA